MINAGTGELGFQLQEGKAKDWYLVADTSLPSPRDFIDLPARRRLPNLQYAVGSRSVVILCRRRE